MATITVTKGYNDPSGFTSGETITPAKLNSAQSPAVSISSIVNADIDAAAAIAFSKLAALDSANILVGNGSNVATKVAMTGDVTISNAGVVTLARPLTLATAKTYLDATLGGTVIDFTGIPSWVKRITVMLNGVSTNSTSVPIIQIGTSGGLQNSGYSASAGFVQGANSNTALFATGFGLNQAHLAASVYSGHVAITNITGNSWVASLVGAYTNVSGLLLGSGSVTLSGTLDRVRLTTVNGTDTFDAGSVNILYEG